MLASCENTLAQPMENQAPAEGAAAAAKKQKLEAPTAAGRTDIPLFVKRHSEHAKLPVRGSAGAAGYDLARCAQINLNVRGQTRSAGGLQQAGHAVAVVQRC